MVYDELAELLAEISEISVFDISPALRLTKEQGIEPVELARLVLRAEKHFKVVIYDELVMQFGTLGAMAAYIEGLIEENSEIMPVESDEEREAWYY